MESRRRLSNQMYNIVVSLKTTIPLQGIFAVYTTNPSMLYSTLTTNLVNSVNSGVFTQYLQTSSPSFANSTVLSLENDKYIITDPNPDKKKNANVDFYSIIYVALFSLVIMALVIIHYIFQRKQRPYKQRFIQITV